MQSKRLASACSDRCDDSIPGPRDVDYSTRRRAPWGSTKLIWKCANLRALLITSGRETDYNVVRVMAFVVDVPGRNEVVLT